MSGAGSEQPLRILCLSPLFAPIANPEAFCSSKMVMALMEQGVDVTVIYDDGLLERDIQTRDSSRLWDSLADVSIPTMAPAGWHTFGTFYNTAKYGFYRRDSPRWVDTSVRRAVELHQRKPFDLVYSRCLPVRGCVAGYWIARALNLPWGVNINDPWALYLRPETLAAKRSPLHVMVYQYWLEKTLRTADLITYPCSRLAVYTARCAGVRHNWTVIPHIGLSLPTETREEKFTLVHAGILGQDTFRTAEGLLKGLQEFLKRRPEARSATRLSFIGLEDADTQALVAALGLHSVVTASGRVNYEESLRHIAEASVCVLVEVKLDEGIFLPSKVADYFAAGKPMLALSPATGTVADMTGDPGLVRADTDDPKGIARAIEDFYEDYRHGCLDRRRPSAKLAGTFNASKVVGEFLDAVDAAGIRRRERPRPRGVILRGEQSGRYRLSSTRPKVSVVIATYGREDVLCDTIRMVLSDPYENKELVVVDQTPEHTPATRNYLESIKDSIRYIRMDRPDLTRAENQGIGASSGEIVLFIDDDVDFEPGLIESHVRNYTDESIAGVTGLVLDRGRPPMRRLPKICRNHRFGYLFFRHEHAGRVLVANVAEGNMSFRRRVLLDVGRVDENFVDIALLWGMDLAVRVVTSGGKIVHDPACRLVHLKSPTGGVRTKRFKPIAAFRNLFYFIHKHLAPHERFSVAMRYYFYRVLTPGWRRPWRIPSQTRAFIRAWRIEGSEAAKRDSSAPVVAGLQTRDALDILD